MNHTGQCALKLRDALVRVIYLRKCCLLGGRFSDGCAEKSVAVEFCSMWVYQRIGCEVAGGGGKKIL
jgi:hypothetical protein